MKRGGQRRAVYVGAGVLAALWGLSFLAGGVFAQPVAASCPFGRDLVRPDESVCTLAFGGLWVSLSVGIAAALLASAIGLALGFVARLTGGLVERWVMRVCDSFFSLPDVLILMVLQTSAQTLGDLNPAFAVSPPLLMVLSLALVGWAAAARMIRDRLYSLEQQEFVSAARALGSSRAHLVHTHLWPALKPFLLGIFLARIPAAILAESTISFFGIARMEPMSLGRYLGTSYSALVYEGGGRIVGPAWALLVLVVLAASLAARAVRSEAR